LVVAATGTASATPPPFLNSLKTLRIVASTVPGNGDVNPYGVAVVPRSTGRLHRGWVLVSNFNAADGLIVETTPSGSQVATATLDATGTPPGAGALFGMALTPNQKGIYFVDDATNTLNLIE
jgi:hypothetical protein